MTKTAELIGDDVLTYNTTFDGQKINKKLTSKVEFTNKIIIDILIEKGEGSECEMFDEEENRF